MLNEIFSTKFLIISDNVVSRNSAGVGRTGTFIVLDAMLKRMTTEGNIDIFNYTVAIRDDRTSMIQTEVSYYTFKTSCIYDFVLSR